MHPNPDRELPEIKKFDSGSGSGSRAGIITPPTSTAFTCLRLHVGRRRRHVPAHVVGGGRGGGGHAVVGAAQSATAQAAGVVGGQRRRRHRRGAGVLGVGGQFLKKREKVVGHFIHRGLWFMLGADLVLNRTQMTSQVDRDRTKNVCTLTWFWSLSEGKS